MRKHSEKTSPFLGIFERVRKYARLAVILLFIMLGLSLLGNISKISEADKKIKAKEAQVEKLRQENEEIKKRLEGVTSEVYVEKQLRDSLGLSKEGEIVIVLPDKETLKSLAPKLEEEEDTLPDPNWKMWLKLFI
jgi:cell division protein FtsB